jgi:hypothetical protein
MPKKRTFIERVGMSALCHEQTFRVVKQPANASGVARASYPGALLKVVIKGARRSARLAPSGRG